MNAHTVLDLRQNSFGTINQCASSLEDRTELSSQIKVLHSCQVCCCAMWIIGLSFIWEEFDSNLTNVTKLDSMELYIGMEFVQSIGVLSA